MFVSNGLNTSKYFRENFAVRHTAVTIMYVRKVLLEEIINLFTEKKDYRDDRWATVEYIVENHYRQDYGKDILSTAKLIFDIDRGFRYVQQYIPELRGSKWLKRQRQGGRISVQQYENMVDEEFEQEVKDLAKQLKLF